MKKIITSSVAVLLLLSLFFTVPAVAENNYYLYDNGYYLTDEEYISLNSELEELYSANDIPLYMIVKQGDEEYEAVGCAEEFYNQNKSEFNSGGSECGFIFVDDFDNYTFCLYPVGNASQIISSDNISTFLDNLNEVYDEENLPATYEYVVDFVSEKITSHNKYGEDYDYSAPATNGTNVNDDADLLTDEEEATLITTINTIKDKYSFDVVIHTTNDIGDKTIVDYADDYYDYNGFGCGENKDGLLFMLSMGVGEGNSDYYTSTCGYGITAFTDYAIYDSDSVINSIVVEYLSQGEYYEAFTKYLSLVDEFLNEAKINQPYDYNNEYDIPVGFETVVVYEAIAVVIALIIAAINGMRLKRKMKTNVLNASASDYLKKDSLEIRESWEVYSHSDITKTARASSSSSGGGSSSHSSSSGSSHGGGGGSF